MRTRLLALAVAVAAVAFPTAPARADDPVNCPILASLSPGIPGVIDIDAEGDVAVDGMRRYDCPPYGDDPGPRSDYVDGTLELVGEVFDVLNTWCEVDLCIPPTYGLDCPVLVTLGGFLGGGVPGVVDINNQGDVYVNGRWYWDCPPYGVR